METGPSYADNEEGESGKKRPMAKSNNTAGGSGGITADENTLNSANIIILGTRNDGHVVVSFSEDDIECRADFFPPIGNGTPINQEYINSLLERLNITYGVQWDTILETTWECNQQKRPVMGVLIAKGEAPTNEVSDYYEMNPHLIITPPPQPRGNARIDYRTFSPYTIIKQDQVLARLKPRRIGKEGMNIHGISIPFKEIHPEGVSGGTNTRTDEKFILSNINGQLVEAKRVLNVQKNLVIKGAVGYATGNIIFPGDVTIDGPVSDGFKIYSGGSVTIKQTFDVTEASTKGDLTVMGGIIGRGRALVKVGGALRTKFIENCRVACRKGITVDTEIINSSVFTMETLELADKGMILGSDIYAIRGLRAGSIGKKSGKAAQIHCGIDFTLQQEKEKCNTQLRILGAKLTRLRDLMAQPNENADKRTKMEQLFNRLTDEQNKNTLRISELLGQITSDENAAVEVLGEIAPGTLIEICQVALFVSEPLRKVRIRLDRGQGKLVSENI
ncbi:hypothetical protein FACS189493_3910 [Spirochaetia bacterium]|nr:hypothetical protein FACS189493_3910 [Spirochaetia bacterium]